MDKNREEIDGNEFLSFSPDEVIKEIKESIESADRKIQRFYEIHATEMQVKLGYHPDFRREK